MTDSGILLGWSAFSWAALLFVLVVGVAGGVMFRVGAGRFGSKTVRCPECGRRVSRFVPSCPQCGRPTISEDNP